MGTDGAAGPWVSYNKESGVAKPVQAETTKVSMFLALAVASH
jgi:hypothetical protein